MMNENEGPKGQIKQPELQKAGIFPCLFYKQ